MGNNQFKRESLLGFIFVVLVLLGAYVFIDFTELYVRFIIGTVFGFALVRASLGFAGSVNKLYRTKSAYVAKMLIYIFILTAFMSAFVMYGDESSYRLSIYPINFALMLGGIMFGFGMALSSCCATGSLTDLASGFSRAFVTIIFFSFGVFLGFNIQHNSESVTHSFFSTPRGLEFQGGVFLPDLFTFDGFNGYLGAMMLTLIFGGVAIYLATAYEKKFTPPQDVETPMTQNYFEKFFISPWGMWLSVVVISLTFTCLFYVSQRGWSASSIMGIWFGHFLMFLGVSPETLVDLTSKKLAYFTTPLSQQANSLQNIGIVIGAVSALMIAGAFQHKFTAGLKISLKGAITFALGGFIMGFGTRLSHGCNVGALYTPIAEFSLSGWIYLIFVVIGGFLGNIFIKKFISKSCQVV